MGTTEFAAFVRRALFLDRGEATAAWAELRHFQARLIERLKDARELRIEAEGTDLTLSVEGRTWVNSDGKRNMPSGEVFTGPRRDAAPRAASASRSPPARAASRSRASSSSSARAASSTRAPSAARST